MPPVLGLRARQVATFTLNTLYVDADLREIQTGPYWVDGLLWDDDDRFPAADATADGADEDDGPGLLRCKQLAILTAILVALLAATLGLLLGGKDDAGGDAPFLRGRERGRGPGVSNGPAASTVGPAGRGWVGRTYADAREF